MKAAPPCLDGAAGRPYFGAMRSLVTEIDDFGRDVLLVSHERPVLAEFWAPWSGSCAKLRPRLEQAVAKYPGRLELRSVNIEMHPGVVEQQGVEGLPLVKAYANGRAIGELTGVPAPDDLAGWVESLFSAAEEAGLAAPARPAGAAADKPPRR